MLKDEYPKDVTINNAVFTFRLMEPADRNTVLNMTQHLSERDLLFMRRDITQPEAVDEWVRDIKEERALTVLVETEGNIIAYGTLYHHTLFWNRHMGEIRFLVSSPYRNRGLGTRITRELVRFADDMGLSKVVSYMAATDKGAQRVVEELNFRPEALLADWVKTRDDRTHDLVIMSTALNGVKT